MKFWTLLSLFVCLHQAAAFVSPQPSSLGTYSQLDSRRFNFFENIGSMITNWGKKATVSHILIGPKTMGEVEAKAKLTEVKAQIDNDPAKFAAMAAEVSTCRASKTKGGDLGTFGAGMMVKPFDRVCFEEEVGVVHGPGR